MNKAVTQTPTLRERIVAVLRENREVRNIGALANELEAVLFAQAEGTVADDARMKAAFNHGYVIACCNVTNLHDEPGIAHDTLQELGVTKAEVKRMDLCDYDAKALREIERARGPNSSLYAVAPARQERQQDDLGKIEIHLQKLIEADPDKARTASSNEDLRMWFVAELISEASGRIPLLEIEGLVSRHLAASKGGDA